MVHRIELTEQQLGFQVRRLQARDGLVLGDCQLQHLDRLCALHVSQRTQIDLPQQGVGRHIVRVPLQLILRGAHRVLDPPDLEVEIGQSIFQQDRVGIGIQRQLVLLHRLGRVVRASGADRHLLVEMRQPVVVVGAGAVGFRLALTCGCLWCRTLPPLQRLLLHRWVHLPGGVLRLRTGRRNSLLCGGQKLWRCNQQGDGPHQPEGMNP